MVNLTTILKHNVIGKLTNHLLVFLINIVIVRSLTASESGTYFNELYLINFVVFIFSAGLDYASISLIAQEGRTAIAINRMLIKVVLFFTCLSAILLLVSASFKGIFSQPAVAVFLFSVGNIMLIFYQGLLSALRKFNLQNVVLFVGNIAFLLYLFLAKQNSALDISRLQIAYAILFLSQGLAMWLFTYKYASPFSHSIVAVKWVVFLRAGFYFMISSLIYFAFLRVDNFFVEMYTDKITLGNYVQCGKIGQYFLYFSSVISSTLLPFIAAEKIGNSYHEWKKILWPYVILIFLAAITIGLAGESVFPAIFGDDFKMMHRFMIILLPGFVCLGILTLVNAVYIGKGNIKRIIIGDVLGLILVVALDWIFVPRFGAFSAAAISSIVYCLVFVFLWVDFKRQFSLQATKNTLHF